MNALCVIIGAGHAAAQLCASLRTEGWSGEIVLIGDEPHLPYQRPPLSKTFLAGEKNTADLLIRPAAFYAKNAIQWRQGRVVAIDRATQMLTLSDGSQQPYDKLALCMGARVRRAMIQGENVDSESIDGKSIIDGKPSAGVHYLRNIADVQGIAPELQHGRRAVMIGGGYIGLETAAALRKQGMQVLVLEAAKRILARVTAPAVAEFYQRVHAEEGVQILTGISVIAIEHGETCKKIICSNGLEFLADVVMIGVGVLPNVELAQQAGLPVDQGIVVDEFCQTQDHNIVAAGDCTQHFNPVYQRNMRLESVPNANEQAKTAAATLCGKSKPCHNMPWFWSDQYDLKLQIAGLSQGYDQVVLRGDPSTGRSFAAFYFQQGRLIAADCINRPQEFIASKKIISDGGHIDTQQIVDESCAVKMWTVKPNTML